MVYIHIWYINVLARGSEFGGKRRSDRAYLRLMVAYVCCVEFGLFLLVSHHDTRPRERSDRGRFSPIGQRSLFIPGCVQGAII